MQIIFSNHFLLLLKGQKNTPVSKTETFLPVISGSTGLKRVPLFHHKYFLVFYSILINELIMGWTQKLNPHLCKRTAHTLAKLGFIAVHQKPFKKVMV